MRFVGRRRQHRLGSGHQGLRDGQDGQRPLDSTTRAVQNGATAVRLPHAASLVSLSAARSFLAMELPRRRQQHVRLGLGRERREELSERIHDWLDLPVAMASVLMVLLVIVQLTSPLNPAKRSVVAVMTTGVWAFLLASFLLGLAVAADRRRFLRRHWLSLVAAALPFLSFLRVLSVLRVFNVVASYLRLFVFGRRTTAPVLEILRRRRLGKVALVSVFVVGIATTLEYLVESGVRGANIQSLGDALWWAAATATTVGSQLYPVTTAGQLIAFALMLYAIAIITYFMASLASALVGNDTASPPPSEGDVTIRVTREQAIALRQVLAALPEEDA